MWPKVSIIVDLLECRRYVYRSLLFKKIGRWLQATCQYLRVKVERQIKNSPFRDRTQTSNDFSQGNQAYKVPWQRKSFKPSVCCLLKVLLLSCSTWNRFVKGQLSCNAPNITATFVEIKKVAPTFIHVISFICFTLTDMTQTLHHEITFFKKRCGGAASVALSSLFWISYERRGCLFGEELGDVVFEGKSPLTFPQRILCFLDVFVSGSCKPFGAKTPTRR